MEIPSTELQARMATLQASSATDGGIKDLHQATEKFEAIFLRQFLGKALEPLLHNTPGSNAAGAGVYQYMITDALAGSLAEQGQFGFSSLLRMQLMGEGEAPPPDNETNLAQDIPPHEPLP
ncbi:MAG: hypothetical protein R6V45_04630 [Oceanipulchritudo sp.]